MGFFSWKTQDTRKSIANCHSSRDTFKVIMADHKGNKWVEENYGGYGMFGGKDFYVLADQMNGGKGNRDRGIALLAFKEEGENLGEYWTKILKSFGKHPPQNEIISPSLSESGKYYGGKEPKNCKHQGYFY